jgi:hypothetical protein
LKTSLGWHSTILSDHGFQQKMNATNYDFAGHWHKQPIALRALKMPFE